MCLPWTTFCAALVFTGSQDGYDEAIFCEYLHSGDDGGN
jgi:hypothetical protein